MQGISEYLDGVLREHHYDLAVCIERRGFALFREAHRKWLAAKHPSLLVLPSGSTGYHNFSGKSVLVFDDTLNKGTRARIVVEYLKEKGASQVDVAVLAKRDISTYPTLKPLRLLNKRRYEAFADEISGYLDSALMPADIDHMYVIGELEPAPSRETLMLTLSPLGEVYSTSGPRQGGIVKLGVCRPTFLQLSTIPWMQSLQVPQLKTRVNYKERSDEIDNEGDICIFPIAYPIIIEDPREDPPPHSVGYCLCSRYQGSPWVTRNVPMTEQGPPEVFDHFAKWFLYSHCLEFNLSTSMLINFLGEWKEQLKKTGCQFHFQTLIYDRGREMIQDAALLDYVQKLIRQAVE
jgi:hypothetical protein